MFQTPQYWQPLLWLKIALLITSCPPVFGFTLGWPYANPGAKNSSSSATFDGLWPLFFLLITFQRFSKGFRSEGHQSSHWVQDNVVCGPLQVSIQLLDNQCWEKMKGFVRWSVMIWMCFSKARIMLIFFSIAKDPRISHVQGHPWNKIEKMIFTSRMMLHVTELSQLDLNHIKTSGIW